MLEVWKDIVDYEGSYQVSNLGRIKSLYRKVRHKNNSLRTLKERILKPGKTTKGYMQVMLHKDGKGKQSKVHRVVAIAFIKNTESKPQVNHINGIKTDNHVDNLEWCTQSENMVHSIENGLKDYKFMTGENNMNTHLSFKDVSEIRKSNKCVAGLAKEYNVSKPTIRSIIQNKTWKED